MKDKNKSITDFSELSKIKNSILEHRLDKVSKEFDVSIATILEFLKSKGCEIVNHPRTVITDDHYILLVKEYQSRKNTKYEVKENLMSKHTVKETIQNNSLEKSKETNVVVSKKRKGKRPRIKNNEIGKPPLEEILTTTENKKSSLSKENKTRRLSKIANEFHTNVSAIIQFLKSRKYHLENNPMSKISDELYHIVAKGFRAWISENQSKDVKKAYKKNLINNNQGSSGNLPEVEIKNKSFRETFFVDFKDLEFRERKVVFKKWFWQVAESIELTIINLHIHKEFDSIKNYFQNALGVTSIEVEIKDRISFSSIKDIIVSSPEIERIDKNLIDTVRIGFVKKITSNKSLAKSSFTIDKMFESANTKVKSSTFYSEESQLLDDILSIEGKKHFNHLKHLSSKQSTAHKLRFLFKPFSFIFLLEGEEKNYVVWETLDTKEATYIWQIEKNTVLLLEELKKIELIIVSLRFGGKTKYLATTNDLVRTIHHIYSEVDKGFPKWRLELDAITK